MNLAELLGDLANFDAEATPIDEAEHAVVRNPAAAVGDADEYVLGAVSSGAPDYLISDDCSSILFDEDCENVLEAD